MNKLYLLLVFLLSTFMDIQGQVVAVKTNVLYDAITTPNVGCLLYTSDAADEL